MRDLSIPAFSKYIDSNNINSTHNRGGHILQSSVIIDSRIQAYTPSIKITQNVDNDVAYA